MATHRPSLRRDQNGTAGFALVAVALLVVGSASALYLHSVANPQASASGQAERVSAVQADARHVAESLGAFAAYLMDEELAQGGAPGSQGLSALRSLLQARLSAAVDEAYPRLGASGLELGAEVLDLELVPETSWVLLPSVFGGTTFESVAVRLSAQGVAHLTLHASGKPNGTAVVAFAGRSSSPVALPLELASRAAAELLPGGIAERMASQAGQHLLPTANVSTFDGRLARESVEAAVRTTLLWAFGTSGNDSWDAIALHAAGDDGWLQAADLFNRTRADDEAIDVSHAGQPFAVEGGPGVSLEILSLTMSDVNVSVARRAFNGQEAGRGVWHAVETSARGHVRFTARVSSEGAATEVGPIELPVAFDARSTVGPLRPIDVLTPAELAALEQQAQDCVTSCDLSGGLSASGLSSNATANLTAAVRDALAALAVSQMAEELAPVEDATSFLRAFGPARRALNPITMALSGPYLEDGSRAAISVDGAPAGSAVVEGGAVTIARMPEGNHTVGVSVPCAGSTCAGGVTILVDGQAERPSISVAPAPSGGFVASVTRRSVADNLTVGEAALLEAERLMGLAGAGSDLNARLASALVRADLLAQSGTAAPSFRSAVADAHAFLKVSLFMLKATDAARKAAGGSSAPVAQIGGDVALLVLAPETRLLLVATIHGTEIARAAFSNGSIELKSPWEPDGTTLSLDFRLEQVGLVATAALAGLTLGADIVRLQRESREGDHGGLAIGFGKFAAHTADTLLQLTQGLMHVADRFFETASTKAAAATFAKASVVLGAVFFALDVADLYHEAGGNLTLMAEGLLHPASVAGLLTLPSLAQSAASTAAGALLLMTGQQLAAAGPIGIAVGLFVLAGIIVLNGQTVASAIFGTLNPGEREQFASAMGNRTRDLARVLAFSNGANPAAAEAASRSAALASARLSLAASNAATPEEGARLQAQAEVARADSLELATRARVERALRHAALAAMEQMDDFASGNHTFDEGRVTEGYLMFQKADLNQGGTGTFPYGGDLIVQDSSSLPTRTLTRAQWRALLPELQTEDLGHITVGYRLTPTDGIKIHEAERFVRSVVACGTLLSDLMEEYQALPR